MPKKPKKLEFDSDDSDEAATSDTSDAESDASDSSSSTEGQDGNGDEQAAAPLKYIERLPIYDDLKESPESVSDDSELVQLRRPGHKDPEWA